MELERGMAQDGMGNGADRHWDGMGLDGREGGGWDGTVHGIVDGVTDGMVVVVMELWNGMMDGMMGWVWTMWMRQRE